MRNVVSLRKLLPLILLLTVNAAAKEYYMTAQIDGIPWSVRAEGEPQFILGEWMIQDLLGLMEVQWLKVMVYGSDRTDVASIQFSVQYPDMCPCRAYFPIPFPYTEPGEDLELEPVKAWVNSNKTGDWDWFDTSNPHSHGGILIQTFTGTTVEGEFEFTVYNDDGDSLIVTEGKFRVPVSKKPFPPP